MPKSVTVYKKTPSGKYKKVRCLPCPEEDLMPRKRRRKNVDKVKNASALLPTV
jgi:hypothetical protein